MGKFNEVRIKNVTLLYLRVYYKISKFKNYCVNIAVVYERVSYNLQSFSVTASFKRTKSIFRLICLFYIQQAPHNSRYYEMNTDCCLVRQNLYYEFSLYLQTLITRKIVFTPSYLVSTSHFENLINSFNKNYETQLQNEYRFENLYCCFKLYLQKSKVFFSFWQEVQHPRIQIIYFAKTKNRIKKINADSQSACQNLCCDFSLYLRKSIIRIIVFTSVYFIGSAASKKLKYLISKHLVTAVTQ